MKQAVYQRILEKTKQSKITRGESLKRNSFAQQDDFCKKLKPKQAKQEENRK